MAQPVPEFSLRAAFGVDPKHAYALYRDGVTALVPNARYSLGANADDAMSHASGVVVGTPIFGTKGAVPRSDACRFDGGGDEVTIADAAGWLRFTTDLTLEAWVCPDTTSGTDGIFATYLTGPLAAYELSLVSGVPTFTAFNAAGTPFTAAAPAAVPLGEFTHLVVTYAAGGGQPSMKLYVDGELVASANGPTAIRAGVGGAYIARTTSGVSHFDGTIDEVALYNFALSPAQILANFQHGWTDLTDRFDFEKSHFWKRGRKTILDRFEAGTAAFVLRNDDQQLDPFNTSAVAPYLNNIVPDVPLELSVLWTPPGGVRTRYVLWTGYVDEWIVGYDGRGSVCTVTATDHFKFFAEDGPADPLEAEIRADAPAVWFPLTDYNAETNADLADKMSAKKGLLPAGFVAAPSVVPFTAGQGAVGFTDGHAGATFPQPIVGATTPPFTVAGWFRCPDLSSAPSDSYVGLVGAIGSDETLNNGDQLAIVISPTSGYLAERSPVIGVFGLIGGGFTAQYFRAPGLNDGLPHSFMYVATTSSVGTLYVDGATGYAISLGLGTVTLALASWWIGAHEPTPTLFSQGFSGAAEVSNVTVYDGALSGARALAHHVAGMTGWDGDTSGARISRLVTFLGADIATSIDTGNTLLQGSTLDANFLDHMQRVAESENGGLWTARDGTLRFRGRHSLFRTTRYAVSQATFGDRGSDLRYESLVPVTDRSRLVKKARIARRGGPVQEAVSASTATGPRKHERTDLAMRDDNLANDYARWVTSRFGTPRREFREITIAPGIGDDAVTAAYLALDLEDRITAKKVPPGGGAAINVACHIQSDENRLDGGRWRCTMALAAAEATQYFTLNDNVTGKLNGGYPLAF